MGTDCKGICIRYKAKKPVDGRRYAAGQRRCSICYIFINWEGLWCPCCSFRLRLQQRDLRLKEDTKKHLESKAIPV